MKKILVATVKPFAPEAINKMKDIAKTAGYQLNLLEKYSDKKDLLLAVSQAEGLIIRSDIVDKEVLEAGKNLKIVVRAGAGYDNIDLDSASKLGICVMNTPGQNSNAVAELAFGMIISLIRNNFQGTAGFELKGKTIGFHGAGNVVKEMARIAKGFGMNILLWNHRNLLQKAQSLGATPVTTLEELYSKSQFVSVNIPFNKNTSHCIGAELLSKLPPKAVFINTARKELICENDLLKVMTERSDLKYVSDIAPDCIAQFESDFKGRYLFSKKKTGAQTAEANLNAGIAAVQQIVDYIEKGIDTYKVNN